MTTRKAIVLVNGLFQELSTPTDKLDFGGNSTSDLTEGSNLYYTDVRSRLAISVTDSGGDGSLSYDNSTGVITYTGPSASEVRAHLSAATSGTGFGSLTYDNSTGVFTYSVVTAANIRQQISVTDSGGDGSLSYDNSTGVITYTGPTASDARSYFSVATGSGLTYNSSTGEFGTNAIPNAQLANSSITFGTTAVSLGSTVTGLTLSDLTATNQLTVGSGLGANNSISIFPNQIIYEGTLGDANQTILGVVNPTADRTITFPDASGTVALLTSLSVAVGSGLTYNSSTGEFGTNAIPNAQLANSNIQIGSTSIALGSSTNTIAGLSSLTSSKLYAGTLGTANSVYLDSTNGSLNFEGATADAFITSIVVTDPTATRTVTLQDLSGTVALSTNKLSFFSATTSAELAGVISDETGSGALVFANSPALTTPSLGVATATSINKVSITAPATGSTLTIADGKTFTVSNTLTFTGTDGSSVNFGAGGSIAYLGVNNAFTGANTFTNSTGQTFRQASTQDGIIVTGRAGGTSSYAVTFTPGTLTGNRTLTAPDETGTVATQDFATAIAIALG